jgi:ABC-2 type transport system permease protein
MKNIIPLIKREFGLFWSNKVFVVAFLLMPLVISVVFGFVYKKGKVDDLPIIVVDKDQTPSSVTLRDMLGDDPVLKVVETRNETINLQHILLEKKATGVVVIPYRFEADLLAGRKPEVACYLNMGLLTTANAAGAAIATCAATMNAGIEIKILEKRGISPSLAPENREAFHNNLFLMYNRAGNYLYFLWPALIFGTLHQLLLLALAVGFSREMEAGTFSSILMGYSRNPAILLVAKVFPYILLSLPTIGCFFLLSIYFHIPFPEHPFALLTGQLLLVLAASLLACCYSILIPLPLKASQLLMSIASPAFTISGFTWPSGQEPAALAAFSQIIPLTPYEHLGRMALLQKAGWMDVLPEISHLGLLIVIYFFLAVSLLYFKIRKTGEATK